MAFCSLQWQAPYILFCFVSWFIYTFSSSLCIARTINLLAQVFGHRKQVISFLPPLSDSSDNFVGASISWRYFVFVLFWH